MSVTSPADLRAERLNRGLSISRFAEEIGVAPHVLKYTERGGRPQPENAKKIADYFDVKVTALWPVDESVSEKAA